MAIMGVQAMPSLRDCRQGESGRQGRTSTGVSAQYPAVLPVLQHVLHYGRPALKL